MANTVEIQITADPKNAEAGFRKTQGAFGRMADGIKRHRKAIGVGSFGPVDPRPGSPTWGYITTTPKPGWQYTDVAGALMKALGAPVAFDTDVNAAALGEKKWGAAQDVSDFIYLTIGTGIGGGGVIGGSLMHGLLHPCILRWGTCASPTIGRETPSKAHAPIMAIVWRGWRRDRPSPNAGASPQNSFPPAIPPGR